MINRDFDLSQTITENNELKAKNYALFYLSIIATLLAVSLSMYYTDRDYKNEKKHISDAILK